MKTISYLIALFAVAFTLSVSIRGWVAPVATAGAKSNGDNRHLGSDVCTVCHIDFARKWAGLDHSKKLLGVNLSKDVKGCEACHGPGGQHVSGNRKSIVSWGVISSSQKSTICLQCHAGKVESKQWQGGPHAGKDVTCSDCHEVHDATKQEKLLRQPENDLCLQCHSNIKKAAEAKTHHPLPEDVLTCTSCHNPHGTQNAKLLIEPKSKLCATCHGEDVPKPDSHKDEDWVQKHGPSAKTDAKPCQMCHDKKEFCSKCHE